MPHHPAPPLIETLDLVLAAQAARQVRAATAREEGPRLLPALALALALLCTVAALLS